MLSSKLIQLYQTLSGNQLEAFKKWVHSPVHNKHEGVSALMDYIFDKQKLTERTLQKQKIFAAIYPDLPFDDLRLRHLGALAVKQLEGFLVYWNTKDDQFSQQLLLAKYATQQQQEKLAKQYLKKATKIQAKHSTESGAFFYQNYELEAAIFEQKGTQTRIRSTNLQAIFDSHSTAFAIRTLQYACIAITHQNIYKGSYQIPLLATLLESIEQGDYDDCIAIQLYYHSYQCLHLPNEEQHFEQLQQLLFDYPNLLPAGEIKDTYLIAINYCVKRLNTGAEQYIKAVFELFKYGLEHQILIENGRLSRFTYKNIVTAALKLQQHDWTAQFIATYTPLLSSSYQQTYALFAEAKLALSKHELERTQELLWQVEFDDLLLNIGAKMMLVKVYYQQENWAALDSLLHSFYVFLQRKELMGYHRTNYKNILRLLQKIIRTPSFERAARQKLVREIETTNPLTERDWLLQLLQ